MRLPRLCFGALEVDVEQSAQTSTSFPNTLPLIKSSDERELTHKSAASEGLFPAKASYVFLVTGET